MRNLSSDFILNRMMTLHPKVIDLTLDRVWSLLEALGIPKINFPKLFILLEQMGKVAHYQCYGQDLIKLV